MRDSTTILFILWMVTISSGWAQRSPFSLQAAVDELHRQEYPLNAPTGQQSRYMAGAFAASPDQDYWDEDAAYTFNTKKQRNRINKQLAKYLERENYEADHGGLTLGPFGGYEFDADSNRLSLPPYTTEERKRSSVFRERSNLYDESPASIFRERDVPDNFDRSELTDQFLREIERSQEHGHQDRYKEALRNLWEKYQQQENEIDGDVYEKQKKRVRMPPYYMLMQKKRSYPVLPWLPVERRKRFPVSKRSTNHMGNDSPLNNLGKTDENVERELSELFGSANDDKKKRSIDDKQPQASSTSHSGDSVTTAVADMRLETDKNATKPEETKPVATTMEPMHHQHGGHTMSEHKHGKRSNHPASHESHEEDGGEEEEEDSEEEHESEEEDEEHEHEHEHDHDHEEDDEEAKKRKKKRDAASSAKRKRNVAVPLRRTMESMTMRSKKSIDWSKYFGLDRKKKAMSIADSNKTDVDMKKRDVEEDNLQTAGDDADKKKRNIDPTKLENMNKKLQAIEDFIINETIKYTGAHEGIGDPDEIQRLKDRVLSRLATAYSLEKMRRALEKLRQSVENENHLMHNVIEPDSSESSENTSLEATKREKSLGKSQPMINDEKDDEMKRKMKKSNGFMRYPDVPNEFGEFEEAIQGPNRYETLNDAYLGNKNYILGTNQCPILESMAQRCRGVDLLSGDVNQELLPLCGVHQLCYLCGTSQISCDYQYLAEADAVCGPNNNDCQATARSVLMILRGTPGPQLGPRECVKNSCLYSAMREIGL
ncbi:uncharacterized protein isoform X1 [Musca autumnalis]|uniref:uncharacterized protein isoform X1 n=1 Tax=Musca autumnalis TaxID=221902 RepID=UPI003CF1E7EF